MVPFYTSAYCPDGWRRKNTTDGCYYVSQQIETFNEARNYCNNHGGSLIVDRNLAYLKAQMLNMEDL